VSVRLPSSLTWRFGDYRPPPVLEAVEGTGMAWTESIADRGQSRLLSEFRDKPRIVAYLRAVLGAGVQDLHDALYQAITERWVDTAIGAQLDRLGWLLDLPRSGWPDETYRLLLRAQVLVLRSTGTWRDAGKILRALGISALGGIFEDSGTAAATVHLPAGIEDGNIRSKLVFWLLNRAKAAAVRFELVYPTTVASSSAIASHLTDDLSHDEGAGHTADDGVGGLAAGVWASTTTETY
jgi:hypothetical protein